MNCKPGDIAICVSGHQPLIGRIVTIDRVSDVCLDGLLHWKSVEPVPHPVVTGKVVAWADIDMRPIRDEDGEDETFEWAGKPCQQPA